MATPLTIKIFKGDALVGTRDFNLDIIKIGRLSAANLCLDDERVSRIHSVIDTSSGGNISILDMGSAEGTFVNGKRVNKGVLNAGDEIRLGNTRLVLGVASGNGSSPSLTPQAPAPLPVAAAEVPTLAIAPDLLADMRQVTEATTQVAAPVAPAATEAEAQPAETLAAAAAPLAVEPPSPRPIAAGRPARPRGAPAALDEGGEDGVEVRVFWGDSLLGSTFQAHAKSITLGDTDKCDFQIPGQGLPAQEFPIVEAAGTEMQLVFDSSMDGEVQAGEGEPRRLRDIAKGGGASPHGIQGCHAVALPSGSFAWLQLSTLRVEVEVKPIPRRIAVPFWAGLDYRWLNLLLVFGFAMMAFIITAAMTPLDTDTVADDLFRNPTAMAKFIVKPPPKTKNPWAEKLKGDSKAKGEPAEKHKGDEGAMGKKNAPKRNTKSAPKAIDVNAKELVKNSGLMRMLGGGGGGLSTILGTGGLGGDLKGAIGHMFGPSVGDASGMGGLGLRGTGVGGGGFGNTIGIGDIGTKGRGGGLGGYGNGIGGMGRKGGSDVAISSGNPIVEGSLDKELIRRVIHQHRNQVRFCYESELVRHQGLNGKVMVKFIISANGSVQRASVDNSTLGNATVENCIVSRVYQWEFPKPKGGGIVVVNYPFLLKESGE